MVASVRQQYGLRIQSDEFADMSWDEFRDLVSGLNDETPLVKVAMIRTESDPERLKQYSPSQRAMHSEWQRRRALKRPEGDTQRFLADMEKSLSSMFGGG